MDANEVPRPLEVPWYYQAACEGEWTNDWFPDDREYRGGTPNSERAKQICNTVCTVRLECLAEAMIEEQKGPRFGIRGGLTATERRSLAKKLRRYYAAVKELG